MGRVSDGVLLADGWGPDSPPDDTLVRAGVVSLCDRIRHMAEALGRDVLTGDTWVGASLASSGLFSNALVVTRPVDEWRPVVDALHALAGPGVLKLLVSPFPTPDLADLGLHLVGHPPFMIRPAGPCVGPGLADVRVERVDTADLLCAFERTLIEAYPVGGMDPSAVPVLFPESYLDGASAAYVALLRGEAVAVSAAHVASGVNHVEFIATRAEARGLGIGAAVTAAATSTDPTLPAVLIASDLGRRIYESLGFLAVTRWTLWLAE